MDDLPENNSGKIYRNKKPVFSDFNWGQLINTLIFSLIEKYGYLRNVFIQFILAGT